MNKPLALDMTVSQVAEMIYRANAEVFRFIFRQAAGDKLSDKYTERTPPKFSTLPGNLQDIYYVRADKMLHQVREQITCSSP